MLTRLYASVLGTMIIVSMIIGVSAAEDSRSSIKVEKEQVVNWKPETKAVKIDPARVESRWTSLQTDLQASPSLTSKITHAYG